VHDAVAAAEGEAGDAVERFAALKSTEERGSCSSR
jgi:hypothetical protein